MVCKTGRRIWCINCRRGVIRMVIAPGANSYETVAQYKKGKVAAQAAAPALSKSMQFPRAAIIQRNAKFYGNKGLLFLLSINYWRRWTGKYLIFSGCGLPLGSDQILCDDGLLGLLPPCTAQPSEIVLFKYKYEYHTTRQKAGVLCTTLLRGEAENALVFCLSFSLSLSHGPSVQTDMRTNLFYLIFFSFHAWSLWCYIASGGERGGMLIIYVHSISNIYIYIFFLASGENFFLKIRKKIDTYLRPTPAPFSSTPFSPFPFPLSPLNNPFPAHLTHSHGVCPLFSRCPGFFFFSFFFFGRDSAPSLPGTHPVIESFISFILLYYTIIL